MGVLRDRMQHDLVVRGLSAHTQRLYLFVVTDLTRYHRRPPDQLRDRDVQRYVRDVLLFPIIGGSSAIQRNNIANRLGLAKG